ncbi:MAG: hypothetical protein F6Q13_18090 [Mycobacterium sp.]|nr:MAG: hypothetical protein F6Q13_18090 [Mycobacterium sp.]
MSYASEGWLRLLEQFAFDAIEKLATVFKGDCELVGEALSAVTMVAGQVGRGGPRSDQRINQFSAALA